MSMTETVPIAQIQTPAGTKLFYTGPDLAAGPLPGLIYFSLSGKESLTLDPFNQPVQFLDRSGLRIFSLDIPGHHRPLAETDAITFWAEQIAKGQNLVELFCTEVSDAVTYLIDAGVIEENKLAVGGLSRGAFLAAHCAAFDKRIGYLLGFAPLTQPAHQKEFQALKKHPLTQALDLMEHLETLCDRKIRFQIGNRDLRVSTRRCYELTEALAETAFQRGIRSPQIELVITPSIGHQGHGTSPEAFQAGAQWLEMQLKEGS